VFDAEAVARMIQRMASEMIERTRGCERLGLVGIQRGGTPIASRLAEEIRRSQGVEIPGVQKAQAQHIPVGVLDITLYRDDAASSLPDPKVGPSRIEWDVEGSDVVLVDDVLQTGRTVRAAIDCLFDYGRPRRIWLAVLCDRGGRHLPIAADFVGRKLEVPAGFALEVVAEGGASDGARLRPWKKDRAE
jgi:pyrimidine operon attenuation protein/uracil phosphoribosyltransferase